MPALDQKSFRFMIANTKMYASGGVWTRNNNAGIPYYTRTVHTTTTGTSHIYIPLEMPRVDSEWGIQIEKIITPVRVGIQNLVSAPIGTLYKRNNLAVTAGGTNMTASSIPLTSVVTATFLATDRLYTFTPTTQLNDFVSGALPSYWLDLYLNCASTTTVRVYDAEVYYITLT